MHETVKNMKKSDQKIKRHSTKYSGPPKKRETKNQVGLC